MKRQFSVTLLALLVLLTGFVGTMSVVAAAGRKMPTLPEVTGGRKAGYVFKPEYEKMVKDLNLAMTLKEYKTVSWADAQKVFEFTKTLPQPMPNELSYDQGFVSKKHVDAVHLPKVFEQVYNKNFLSDAKYGLKNPPVSDEEWLQSFGNIMARFKTLRGKGAETEQALNTMKTKYPAIWTELGPYLPQMVNADFLYSTKWDPYLAESAPGKDNDGILFTPWWVLTDHPTRSAYWNSIKGNRHVYQSGLFIYAPLEQIKITERNFKEYMEYVGMGNLEVAPVAGSYYRGIDNKGDEFFGMEVFNSGQLPFPYNMSSYVMKMLDYYNDKGLYVCEYYSPDRNDLLWMAGRDTYYPVSDTKGQYVGQLITTELGFDIKNLPERDKDRVVSIRANWGNIKLIVEGYKGLSKVSTGPGAWSK